MPTEVDLIKERYARRHDVAVPACYQMVNPSVYMPVQERERAILRWIRECRIEPIASRRLLEIGCGTGSNLLDFLRYGFQPCNLVGNELLPERAEAARRVLPAQLAVVPGDAMDLQLPPESFDVVVQSAVFTSILDPQFQQALAARMWAWAKPGGGVLWYDFVYNNPRNPDVAGVPLRRIRELFPEGDLRYWKVTLAPPLARSVAGIRPWLYNLLNCLTILRTHVLCWIAKADR